MKPLPIRGRGAAEDPPNRFVPISMESDDRSPDDPLPRTRFFRDDSRSIIAYNDSPDVGFNASINPYRGCEHGCAYCLAGDTPILMANGTLKELRDVRPGDEIYGTEKGSHYRYFVRTRVLAHWKVYRPVFRILLADGTRLLAGDNHRFLTWRGWKFVTGSEQGANRRPHLTTNDRMLGPGQFASTPQHSQSYQQGYLCGVIRGDGHLRAYRYAREGRSHENQYRFRLALVDEQALDRASDYLRAIDVETQRFVFKEQKNGRRRMVAIRTSSRENFVRIGAAIRWPQRPSLEWSLGFLAGIFDAEGSYSHGVLRIVNTDSEIIQRTVAALERLGFDHCVEKRANGRCRPLSAVRVRRGLSEHLRFFHSTDPAIHRKRNIEGKAIKSTSDLRVMSVEPLGTLWPLYDITTRTGDFIADGVVSHNCYARPTHEYLGLSAGLDFETRIFVKEDAPELLRRELSSKRWKPQLVALSGVTDPYQPVERRLRITRRCLEVLAETRNPTAIITKNHLVTRDIDPLGQLREYGAIAVSLSVTSLDRELQRVMEPRTSTPERRLDAIRKLASAGIPAGVMVAPVIPGLTDHEMPDILAAAAEAGATRAAFIMLRLPWSVAPLFEAWLERHFPERKEKVLNRLRDLSDGKLYKAQFGRRQRGEGPFAKQLEQMFEIGCNRFGLARSPPPLSTTHFRRPSLGGQL
jgi:DNA repair photolyase